MRKEQTDRTLQLLEAASLAEANQKDQQET